MKSWCKKLLTAGLIFMTAVAAVKTPMPVYADEVSGNSVQYITDDDRWRASVELKNYKESLINGKIRSSTSSMIWTISCTVGNITSQIRNT